MQRESGIVNEEREVVREDEWNVLQRTITRVTKLAEGDSEEPFTPEEYITSYTAVYDLCHLKNQEAKLHYFKYGATLHDDTTGQELFNKYKKTFEDYIGTKEKQDEFMLRELVRQWKNHKVMVFWLYRIFNFLERYFIPRRKLPGLQEVARICFRDMVCAEMKDNVKKALIVLVTRQTNDGKSEDEEKDGALVKDVLAIYAEVDLPSEVPKETPTE